MSGISPKSGPAAGGTAVTISGSNLTGGTVSFGATAATGVSCTASSCTATSPAGTGTVQVTATTGGTSATSTADQFTYQAPAGPPNLLPDPGFEAASVPADHWGSTVARSGSVVHSGSWALAQTLTSSSGGWSLDLNPGWYAPLSSAKTKTYTTTVWVRVRVNLSLDLLDASGGYVDSATGPWVTLTPNMWTKLTVTGIAPTSGEPEGVLEPDFSNGTSGTVIYWDDMSDHHTVTGAGRAAERARTRVSDLAWGWRRSADAFAQWRSWFGYLRSTTRAGRLDGHAAIVRASVNPADSGAA